MTSALLVIATAMLIPPPQPPPPPPLMKAATDVRLAAPLPQEWREQAVVKPTYELAWEALRGVNDGKVPERFVEPMMVPLRRKLASVRPQADASADRCFDQALARQYDLNILLQLRSVVTTRAGKALWLTAMQDALFSCYYGAIDEALTEHATAAAWLVSKDFLNRIPSYAPGADVASFGRSIEAICGRKASGVLQQRGGALGFRYTWVDREIKRDASGETFLCLNYSAKVAGYDLQVFSDE